MNIRAARNSNELKEVLLDPSSTGPEIAYWVFDEVSEGKWENMTVTTSGLYGTEYPKTYGHYHTASEETEVYKLVSGKGIFLLQRKHTNEMGEIVPNKVDEVFLIKAETAGEEIIVPKEYGHSWSNVGNEPLITFDNWRWKHQPTDYTPIKDLHGMVYYLINSNNNIEIVPNPNYIDHPEPKWITPKEFNDKFSPSLTSLV